MSRWIWDREARKWVEPRAYAPPVSQMSSPMIMRPITERVSPVDGSVITCRSQLDEHNKRNNVVDIGDDIIEKEPYRPDTKEIKASVAEAVQKVKAGKAAKSQDAGRLDGNKVETQVMHAEQD